MKNMVLKFIYIPFIHYHKLMTLILRNLHFRVHPMSHIEENLHMATTTGIQAFQIQTNMHSYFVFHANVFARLELHFDKLLQVLFVNYYYFVNQQ